MNIIDKIREDWKKKKERIEGDRRIELKKRKIDNGLLRKIWKEVKWKNTAGNIKGIRKEIRNGKEKYKEKMGINCMGIRDCKRELWRWDDMKEWVVEKWWDVRVSEGKGWVKV
jgi:hypothetical protein